MWNFLPWPFWWKCLSTSYICKLLTDAHNWFHTANTWSTDCAFLAAQELLFYALHVLNLFAYVLSVHGICSHEYVFRCEASLHLFVCGCEVFFCCIRMSIYRPLYAWTFRINVHTSVSYRCLLLYCDMQNNRIMSVLCHHLCLILKSVPIFT